MVDNKFYRDPWARPPPTHQCRIMAYNDRRPCSEVDYPEIEDEMAAIKALFKANKATVDQ
jgi:hypothetical protein